jgi:hypothetical protein
VCPKRKPERLPARKTVTIVAGFKCQEGIVICADSQETVPGLLKRNVPKLHFEPQGITPKSAELAAIFAGATENGPFLDRLVTDCWNEVRKSNNLEEACKFADGAIKHHYKEYGEIYQQGYCPSAEMVFGIKMHGESRLLRSLDAVVNEVQGYTASGVGQYLADFLIPRSFHPYLNIYQVIAIAAYLLFQAKEHVDGCGGPSHIAFLRNKGTSGEAEYAIVDTVGRLASLVDSRWGWILPEYADPSTPHEEFDRLAKDAIRILMNERDENLKKLSEWNDFWKKSIEQLGLEE